MSSLNLSNICPKLYRSLLDVYFYYFSVFNLNSLECKSILDIEFNLQLSPKSIRQISNYSIPEFLSLLILIVILSSFKSLNPISF